MVRTNQKHFVKRGQLLNLLQQINHQIENVFKVELRESSEQWRCFVWQFIWF